MTDWTIAAFVIVYTRYMDDVVVIAPNKEIAREWLAKIKVFLQERLHLETNQKTKIFYVRQGVNAYGFKIKATHLLLRTESKRREWVLPVPRRCCKIRRA